jgi:hypothetical protein
MVNENNTKPITAKDIANALTTDDVAREYGIAVRTQQQWRYLNRHGWRDVTFKLGGKVLHRREDVDAWLNSRKGV